MTQRNSSNSNLPIILGTISILITIIGLLIWITTSFTPARDMATEPTPNASSEEVLQDDRPITTIIVEEQPRLTDLSFLLPLLLTSFGALTSFAALAMEWYKNKREVKEETLTRRIQQLDLELKTLQLYKLRQEVENSTSADNN